jgi:hypothetical protein
MALNKDWRDRPASLAPAAGETLAEHEARINAYAAANPGTLTPLNAVALEDIETRVHDAKVQVPGAHTFPPRALDTGYQPSATRPVLVCATIFLTAPGGARIDLNVQCEAVSPPSTLIARKVHLVPAGVPETTVYELFTFLVPAGFYYMLKRAAIGTGASAGIDRLAEQAL